MAHDQRGLSIKALNRLLVEVIDSPSAWVNDEHFTNALKSQGKMAKLKDDERKIQPCSLNTLKSSADDALDDGFAGLDTLRKNAQKAIDRQKSKEHRPKRGTRVALEDRVKELESQIAALEGRNMTLSYYILELQRLADFAIHSDGSEAARLRHQRHLEVIFAKLASSQESDLAIVRKNKDAD